MDRNQAYDLCCKYQGKRVRITDNRNNVHVGRITKVDNRMVWLLPDNFDGHGLGWGWGYGGYGYGGFGGSGLGYGIAIGAIAGIALASLFFW